MAEGKWLLTDLEAGLLGVIAEMRRKGPHVAVPAEEAEVPNGLRPAWVELLNAGLAYAEAATPDAAQRAKVKLLEAAQTYASEVKAGANETPIG